MGARLGQEVQALRDLGWDCIGFDLLPHAHLVREGDMHSLPVESESFDFIFSNAFDHSLYPRLFVAEMERVVRPGGWIVLHIQLNKQDDKFGVTDVFSADAVSSLFLNSRIVASGPMEEMLSMNYEFVLRRD